MTCQECQDKWSALLDRELSLNDIKAVWAHLQGCHECCRYCCELSCMNAMTQCLDAPMAPERLWRRLQERLTAVPVMEHPSPKGWVVVYPRLSRMGRM